MLIFFLINFKVFPLKFILKLKLEKNDKTHYFWFQNSLNAHYFRWKALTIYHYFFEKVDTKEFGYPGIPKSAET